MITNTIKKASTNKEVKAKLLELYDELFAHNGYGEIKVDMRILHRGQKEIIIYCGKQYRFVVDWSSLRSIVHSPQPEEKKKGGGDYMVKKPVHGNWKG